MLTKGEKHRYSRHTILEHVGIAGQEKLKLAKVLIIGAGGLGCPILQYLTAAGIGTIGIVDDDIVDESNLQRQVLFDTSDIGQSKADTAIYKLKKQNPYVNIVAHNERLSVHNALNIFKGYNVVIDGSDNFPTRYLVNDACIILDKPLVFGSIFKFEGQVAVFNYQAGPSYRCLFPDPPKYGEVPNCTDIGVLGVLPGIIGTKMASECLKIILGIGQVRSGTLELIDVLGNHNQQISVAKIKENFNRKALEEDYEKACGVEQKLTEITPMDLNTALKNGVFYQLIDVREEEEYEIYSIENSLSIPLHELALRHAEILKNSPVVFICHHGARSVQAVNFLRAEGYQELVNLKGGIHAWAIEVDEKMEIY
jgi:adenylyltransferase/sulfurtransferase